MKLWNFIIVVILFFGLIGNVQSFELDSLFLKIAIGEDSNAINYVKIINPNSFAEHILIEVNNMPGLVELSENNIVLEPSEEYNLGVDFKSESGEPGVYIGELIVSSNNKEEKVPVILEIQSKDVLFDSNINLFPQGKDIVSGDKLNTEIRIFDLSNIGRSNVKLIYFVKDFEGGTLVSESEIIVVDGKLDYSKTLDLPDDIESGDYVLGTIVEYENSVGVSSLYFKIAEEEAELYSQNNTLWFFILGGVFILGFLGVIVYLMFYRDRLLIELQKQYRGELRRQKELIKFQEKKSYNLLKCAAEKKEYKKEVKEIEKNRIKELKELQKKRLEEFKKIKKKRGAGALKNQVDKWKKQGYDTSVLEKKYKMPGVDNIKRKIKEWKKKGYDTRVLEK